MNWSRSWSKFCDSDRIVPSPSRSASRPWCWVGRSVMFLFDCWLAVGSIISNPGCWTHDGLEARRFGRMTFLQHDVFRETSYQRNIISKTLEAGWELSRTGIKHDEFEARRENQKLDETLISVFCNIFRRSRRHGKYYRQGYNGVWSLLKIIENIRIGVEKYSGLIADQKIAGRTEIKRMNREARGGSLHGFRTWCQPSNKLSFYRFSRCHRAWKLYMQPDM
ncbi:hypothetical protein YC2023_009264 [Brassica napus]